MNPIQPKYKQTTRPTRHKHKHERQSNSEMTMIYTYKYKHQTHLYSNHQKHKIALSINIIRPSVHPSIQSPSRSMQAAIAAMAHVLLVAAPPSSSHTLLATLPNPSSITRSSSSSSSSSHSPSLHSAFHGVSLKFPSRLNLSLAAVASKKPLTVVAAAKKAVAVLKGTSNVEGVVTLTQEDGGLFSFTLSPPPPPPPFLGFCFGQFSGEFEASILVSFFGLSTYQLLLTKHSYLHQPDIPYLKKPFATRSYILVYVVLVSMKS